MKIDLDDWETLRSTPNSKQRRLTRDGH